MNGNGSGMPRYYFHVYNDQACIDEDGQELDNLADAREIAFESARELVCESISRGHLNLDHRIEIAEASGVVVLRVTFRDAFTITGLPE